MNKKEFVEEFNYFCSKLNLGHSILDGRAIQFMNEFNSKLDSVIEDEIKDMGKTVDEDSEYL